MTWYSSGQRGQTVNLLAYAFVSSNLTHVAMNKYIQIGEVANVVQGAGLKNQI